MELLDKLLKGLVKLTPIGKGPKVNPAKRHRMMQILNCRHYLAAMGSSPYGSNTEIVKRATARARKEELIASGVVDGWIIKRNRVLLRQAGKTVTLKDGTVRGGGSHQWIHPSTPMPKTTP